MRIVLASMLVLLAATAAADTPKAPTPDLVVTWEEGERSRDMSIYRTTITVTGTKLHYTRKYSGRNSGMPGTKPVELDASVKDSKRVTAALDALDKIKVKPGPANDDEDGGYNVREGCVTRGKRERCASARGKEADPADLKAIAAIRDALLDGVKLPILQ